VICFQKIIEFATKGFEKVCTFAKFCTQKKGGIIHAFRHMDCTFLQEFLSFSYI
jgi:hypothetical protein